jgi:3-oxoadipate enol-lactonase
VRDFRWPPPPDGGPRTYGPGPTAPRGGRPTLPETPTELIATPHGVRLERFVTGVGGPVTVFAHGLAGDISGTRPLGSAVTGRRVFFHFRGHGRSDAPPGPWTFGDLARDLRTVADLSSATRAVGVSMGGGALCRLLVSSPDRFDRIVLYLPSALDGVRPPAVRERFARLLAAVGEGDAAAIADVVAADLPVAVRNTPAGWGYLRQRVEQLQRDGLAEELTTLWDDPAVDDPGVLAGVRAKVLIIGCSGDEVHPVGVAERLAEVLTGSELYVYDRPGVLWSRRRDLRERISAFLNQP